MHIITPVVYKEMKVTEIFLETDNVLNLNHRDKNIWRRAPNEKDGILELSGIVRLLMSWEDKFSNIIWAKVEFYPMQSLTLEYSNSNWKQHTEYWDTTYSMKAVQLRTVNWKDIFFTWYFIAIENFTVSGDRLIM